MKRSSLLLSLASLLLAVWSQQWLQCEAREHIHHHLSRKVFERACSAPKDIIDEVVACVMKNEALNKVVKEEVAKKCYKDAFGADFDANEMAKHKELVCKNHSKFEEMTACVYHKMGETATRKEMHHLAEGLADVGLCIVNAIDN